MTNWRYGVTILGECLVLEKYKPPVIKYLIHRLHLTPLSEIVQKIVKIKTNRIIS
jgi:hypothetical protein